MRNFMQNGSNRFHAAALSWLLLSITGCTSMMRLFNGDEEPKAETPVQAAPVGPVGERPDQRPLTRQDVQQLELKQAKLWARIDELEDQLKRSKERLRVLERGLVLGLTPPELQLDQDQSGKKTRDNSEKVAKNDGAAAKGGQNLALLQETEEDDEQGTNKPLKKKNTETTEKGETAKSEGAAQGKGSFSGDFQSKEAEEEYQRRLAAAQEHFRAGRFGQAIAEYGAIGKEFGKNIPGGAHKYWIALSWYNLKEYQTSFNAFNEFITEFPMSPLIPRAKLDMGRVELKLGLKEKAMARFREIMRDFPYEDAAEMARMEMNQLQKNL